MNHEIVYLVLIFALLVIPRALQRWKLPAPLTCLAFGIGAMLLFGNRTEDQVVALLATLGISSLSNELRPVDSTRMLHFAQYGLPPEAGERYGSSQDGPGRPARSFVRSLKPDVFALAEM